MHTNYNGVSPIYILFRHSGGASPDGILPIAATYAAFDGGGGAGTPLVFKDDVAAAETPSRNYPPDTGFTAQGFQLINDSGSSIFFSLDGIRDHWELKAGENILFDVFRGEHLWLRGTAGGEAYRLIVW